MAHLRAVHVLIWGWHLMHIIIYRTVDPQFFTDVKILPEKTLFPSNWVINLWSNYRIWGKNNISRCKQWGNFMQWSCNLSRGSSWKTLNKIKFLVQADLDEASVNRFFLRGKIKRACLKSRPGTVITDSLCEPVVCLMLSQRQRQHLLPNQQSLLPHQLGEYLMQPAAIKSSDLL